MSIKLEYIAIFPIGSSNPLDMPVPDIDRAIPYYEEVLRFSVTEKSDTAPREVTFVRDNVTLRLAENGSDPEQASCYIEVSDVDAAYADLKARCPDIGEVRPMDHGGNAYRVFFVRDPDGLCYCIGTKQT